MTSNTTYKFNENKPILFITDDVNDLLNRYNQYENEHQVLISDDNKYEYPTIDSIRGREFRGVIFKGNIPSEVIQSALQRIR